jgi:hypothetical protein
VYVSEQGEGLNPTLILFQPSSHAQRVPLCFDPRFECKEIHKVQVQMNAN